MTFSLSYDYPAGEKREDIPHAIDWDWEIPNSWARSEKDGAKWIVYEGLDEMAYTSLLNAFGLQDQKEKLSIDKIIKMSPADLARAGTKNPISVTVGDHRPAFEVA